MFFGRTPQFNCTFSRVSGSRQGRLVLTIAEYVPWWHFVSELVDVSELRPSFGFGVRG